MLSEGQNIVAQRVHNITVPLCPNTEFIEYNDHILWFTPLHDTLPGAGPRRQGPQREF